MNNKALALRSDGVAGATRLRVGRSSVPRIAQRLSVRSRINVIRRQGHRGPAEPHASRRGNSGDPGQQASPSMGPAERQLRVQGRRHPVLRSRCIRRTFIEPADGSDQRRQFKWNGPQLGEKAAVGLRDHGLSEAGWRAAARSIRRSSTTGRSQRLQRPLSSQALHFVGRLIVRQSLAFGDCRGERLRAHHRSRLVDLRSR